MKNTEMRTLPMEGLLLTEFVVQGNGKDAEVHVRARNGRRFLFCSRGSCLEIAAQGSVLAEITGPDDATLKIRYTANRLILREVRIHYPGNIEEWATDLDALECGRPMSWTIQQGSFVLLGEESTTPFRQLNSVAQSPSCMSAVATIAAAVGTSASASMPAGPTY